MKKKLIVAIVAAISVLGFCVGCDSKGIDKKICYRAVDKSLESCFDDLTEYKIIEQNLKIASSPKYTYVTDEGLVDGMIDGRSGKYRYSIKIKIPNSAQYDWDLTEMKVYSQKTNELVLTSKKGYHNREYNTESTNTTHSYSNVDFDSHSVEDALQREWNVSNAMSAVGAEDCNVFNVKEESSNGSEVTVSYSLRSTYNGQKKFVDLHGVVKKNSDGTWSVVNLGY